VIVAACASLASRERLLERAVASLLPQVDAVICYLNGYEHVPDSLRHPKVLYAILSRDAGWRGPEAKVWPFDADEFKAVPAPWDPGTIGLTFDDDLEYPSDYVARMVAALDARPGSVACVHGSILTEPFVGWRVSRRCAHFAAGLAADTRVHVPGTGTLAFRVRDWPISIRRDHAWSLADDPAAGIFALRRGVEVWAVARRPNWIRPQRVPQGSSIASQRVMAHVDEVETRLLREAGPWPHLQVPPEMQERGAGLRRPLLVRRRA